MRKWKKKIRFEIIIFQMALEDKQIVQLPNTIHQQIRHLFNYIRAALFESVEFYTWHCTRCIYIYIYVYASKNLSPLQS